MGGTSTAHGPPATLPTHIEAMRSASFYPHPVIEPVRVVQTHISFVVLTGEFAYKVKKPVDLGFLDFTTLERRRHFCREELRLNRRGAPGIYLDVVPVNRSGTDNRFCLNGAGEPVEWALKMRQFPPDSLLSERLEQGTLGDEDVLHFADVVAEFHAGAATGPDIAAYGEPTRVRAAVEANYDHTRRFVGTLQSPEQFERTRAYTEAFFAGRGADFTRRVRSGRVRECHGDLHLANVCLWDGRTLLFDCIEFNEAFRFVDVMYDVAFAAMDFAARGRPDLGNLFVNRYAEVTGDWEGLALLPLYLCRHAYVRAKVNSLLSEDPSAAGVDRARAADEARTYYHLANQYATPRGGRLLLTSGVSGSGKSTVARALARKVGAVHIRSDAVRKHLLGISLHQRAGDEAYSPQVTARVYERLLGLGLRLAAVGHPVILDAKYDRVERRAGAADAAKRLGIPVHVLLCEAPPEVLRQRLQSRTGDVSDATADLLDGQRERFDPPAERERHRLLRLDTARPTSDVVEEACRWLNVQQNVVIP